MSDRIDLRGVARALAVPAALLVIALAAGLTQRIQDTLLTCLIDVRVAHDAAVRAGQDSTADRLSDIGERVLAARGRAGDVMRLLVAVSFFGTVGFLFLGTSNGCIRTATLLVVLLLLFSAGCSCW